MLDYKGLSIEPYEPRGIPNSEMAYIIGILKELEIDMVIESGRARGQSTYCLAKYSGCEIHSIELRYTADEKIARERLSGLHNVKLYMGNGAEIVPELVRQNKDRRIAVLLDGPKGDRAIPVMQECFRSGASVGFIHDMRKLDHGKPSMHRELAIRAFNEHAFSDDPEWVARMKWMDGPVAEAGGPVGKTHEQEFGSYGPTVGAFFPQQ